MTVRGSRIVLAAVGSYGDMNPSLAIGKALRERGHSVLLAGPRQYAADAAREGLEFHAIRPHLDSEDEALMGRIMDAARGSEFVVRDLLMPAVRDMYEDLDAATEGADLLVSHMITYAAPVLAEKKRLRWLSTVLQPIAFLSAHDPPVLAPAPALALLRPLGPRFHGVLHGLLKRVSRPWGDPVRALRRDLGLPEGLDPLFEGQHSPHGVLALFSPAFGPPQPDWPSRVTVCGFPFHDQDFGGKGLSRDLEAFLAAGEPPVAFTLGSSAVRVAGRFYEHAAAAALRLGRRAVLLVGKGGRPPAGLPASVFAGESAPYHALFPRCAALVHSGGVGTTAQALRSGRPQLVVPFAHDQYDNGDRAARFAGGRMLPASSADAGRLARELGRLFADAAGARAAAEVGRAVSAERGVEAACDAVEAALAARG